MIDKDKMLAELLEISGGPSEPRPEEFTLAEFRATGDLGYEAARRKLLQLVNAGLLTRRKGVADGASCWLYRKVEVSPDE